MKAVVYFNCVTHITQRRIASVFEHTHVHKHCAASGCLLTESAYVLEITVGEFSGAIERVDPYADLGINMVR
jgi:hypothetical protein